MDIALLLKLMSAEGVSGSEESVAKIIQKEIKPFVTKVYKDKMGNLIALKKGSKPRAMLAAHMDEVGLMVKRIGPGGLIFLAEIGGLEPSSLVGQRVEIFGSKKAVSGIITTKEISNDWIPDDDKALSFRNLFVDTGLNKKQLIKEGVGIGSSIVLEQVNGFLGSKKIVYGKALDDRVGCFILIELAKRLKKVPHEIVLVFTVQEEIGLYGSKTSTYALDPDWSIVLDIVNANDRSNDNPTKRLGKGPALTVMDVEMIGNKTINGWLKKTAKQEKIPLQPEVSSSGTTDALSIAFSKSGVPTSMLGVAIRNMHTTIGICHVDDIENAIKLLHALLKKKHSF